MALFKKTNVKIYAKPSQKVTPDTVYWKQLSVPVLLKEFGPIDYIDFSPLEPHYFAITCSVRVQIYNPITKLVHKTLSRFRENAYGANFRSDGQLLCVGGEESHVKLFDANSKSLLRVFKGHSAAVHRCYFTADQTHIASFSDDKTVRIWDIPTEKKLHEFGSHEDYIRAGAVSPVSPTTLLSGCYDSKVRMFDTRTNTESVFSVDHGAPVESVIFLPSGGIFVSAGGCEVRVWDALGGGRLLARLAHHHKTVTSLCLAAGNTRLLSASLDRHLKIYDVSTYKVVHTIDYPNSILSMGVSANDETIAVGTVDGLISVSRREVEVDISNELKKEGKKKVSFRYIGDRFTPSVNADAIVTLERKQVDSKHDACLRKFQYSKALDCVLAPYVVNKTPNVTTALMQELIRRKGLSNALINRDEKSLMGVLKFLIKYIGDYRFTSTLIEVANVLIDCYQERLEKLSPASVELLKRLLGRVREEEQLTQELVKLGGAVRMLFAASTVGSERLSESIPVLAPSSTAQQTFVLNVS